MTLYPDQSATMAAVQQSYARGNRAVLLQAACGFGKTQVAVQIARLAREKGRRVIISAPRIQLTDQIENTLAERGVEGVRVDTKQTLVLGELDGDLLIDDEAHYACSDKWAEIVRTFMARGGWVLGLSASPIPGMDRIYQDMVCGQSVEWLMDNGRLSRYRAFGPARPDMTGVPSAPTDYGRDYAKRPTEEIMDRPSVTGDAAEAWFKFARGKRTIGYCISRKHAQSVAEHMRAHGIRAGYIDGTMDKAERARIINMFADREIEWLASVGLVTLGFDMASQVGRDVTIEAMHDLDPTRSLPKHIQKCGRALRRKDDPAVFIDSAGNFERLGFPDDDFEWSIATGTRRKSTASNFAVSICTSCFGAFRTAPACPYCEKVRQLTPREIEEREGELRELERQKEAKAKRIEVGRADGLDALAKIAVERGYATGWLVKRMEIKGRRVGYDEAQRAMGRARAG